MCVVHDYVDNIRIELLKVPRSSMTGIVTFCRRSCAGTLLFQVGVGFDRIFERSLKSAQRMQNAFPGFFVTGPYDG